MLVIDLVWLGILARPIYNKAIGHLLADQTNALGAGIFYLFYVSVVWTLAVNKHEPKQAQKRGAALGFVCYGVYDLTNWAVLKGWPSYIVAMDWVWGVFLTSTVAWCGAKAAERFR